MEVDDPIVPSDFQPPTESDSYQVTGDAELVGDANGDTVDYLAEAHDDDAPPQSSSKGKGVKSGLNDEEKKERQKSQNRQAAERSRRKKRKEQTELESSVEKVHAENEQLRKRLASLQAGRPNAAASSSFSDPPIDPTLTAAALSTPHPAGIGIDYTYLGKLQTELSIVKSTLLEKELELARLKGAESSTNLDALRHLLLSHHTTLTALEAEKKSLDSTVVHLRGEREDLAKQGAVIRRELAARKTRDLENQSERSGVTEGQSVLLDDVSGWMEAAAGKGWEQGEVTAAREGEEKDGLDTEEGEDQ